jgi:iron complex outermembrane receptor protein
MNHVTFRRRPTSAIALAARTLFTVVTVPLAAGLAPAAYAQNSATGAASTTETSASHTTQSALPAVSVSAQTAPTTAAATTFGGGQVARGATVGVLGDQKLINVPFSMTSYTAKVIEDQQARTLADVLDNEPAVRSSLGYGNFAQTFTIRGFKLEGDDISLNGLYGVTPRQLVSTEALERVDVFKGTSAFVNGASPGGTGIGGNINLQLKRADDKPLTRVTMDTSSSGEFGTHLDVGRRFGDNDQFGVRVNVAGRGGETGIDNEHRRSQTLAAAFDYRGEKLRLYADFLYQRVKVDQGRSVVYVAGSQIPRVPSASSNFAQQWTYSNLEDTVGMLRAEYDFLPGWTAYAAGGAHHVNEHGLYSSPTYNGTAGTTTAGYLGVPYKSDSLSAEVGVHGAFATGPVSHKVNVGASIARIEKSAAYSFASSFATSLYNTQQVAAPTPYLFGGDLGNPGVTGRTLVKGVSVSDTIGFLNDRILFTVGARSQSIAVLGYSYTGVENASYNKSLNTPIFGLVLKPFENVSIYANRSEGLAQGGSAPTSAINFGQVFAPYRTKQIEAGIKYDNGQYGANLAVYEIKQPSAYTDAVTRIYSVSGEERHRGIETSVFGEPLKGVRVIAGASLIDAKLTQTASGVNQGNTAIGVPRYLANLGLEYDVPQLQGLTLTGRWIYTSKQYLDAANTLAIKPWNRFDLGARYKTQVARHDVTIRATVQNVTNHSYWESTYGGYLSIGAPRTLFISLSTDF